MGRVNASATVTATWDEDAPLGYIEEAIRTAATKAIARARVVLRIETASLKPQPPYEQLTLPPGP